jgi:Ni,Fe-hydrogenase I cytochrome b subunit
VSEIQQPAPAPSLQGYTPAAAQTNSLAIVSLVSGFLSFFAHVIPFVGGFTVAIIAIITGFMARSQIKRTGEQGMWMANVGILVGFIHLALGFILILVLIFVVFVLGVALFGIAAHSGSAPTPSPIP